MITGAQRRSQSARGLAAAALPSVALESDATGTAVSAAAAAPLRASSSVASYIAGSQWEDSSPAAAAAAAAALAGVSAGFSGQLSSRAQIRPIRL